MVRWRLAFTKQAQKDARKLAAAGLKPKAEELLRLIGKGGILFTADKHPASPRLPGPGERACRESHPSLDSLRIIVHFPYRTILLH